MRAYDCPHHLSGQALNLVGYTQLFAFAFSLPDMPLHHVAELGARVVP